MWQWHRLGEGISPPFRLDLAMRCQSFFCRALLHLSCRSDRADRAATLTIVLSFRGLALAPMVEPDRCFDPRQE